MSDEDVASGIAYRPHEDGSLVTLWGEVDAALRTEASEAMTFLVGRHGPVVIDVERVSFIDSAGIAFVLQVYMIGREAGQPVTLRNPTREFEDMLAIIGMDGEIEITRGVTAA
ncbi:STAS domain-containing protein [Paraoerskovia marina]|nr:STAS domain-containing protein [Paraoerskovia marina]